MRSRCWWQASVVSSSLAFAMCIGCSPPASRDAAGTGSDGLAATPSEGASAAPLPTLEDLATKASFTLVVEKSSVTPLGTRELQTQSAFATYTNEFFGGKVNALKIQFFTGPITEESRSELLRGESTSLGAERSATLILFLDSGNQVTQANLTFMVPGSTVTRTVASTPADVAKGFREFHFDQGKLRLEGQDTFDPGTESDGEHLSLSWTVDVDIPVVDQRTP